MQEISGSGQSYNKLKFCLFASKMSGTAATFAKIQKREQLHAILPTPPQSKAALNAGKLLNVSNVFNAISM